MVRKLFSPRPLKRTHRALFLALLWTSTLSAQDVVRNPSRPIAKGAPKQLALDEILRIRDQGEKYYFRSSPGGFASLGMDARGNIFVQSGGDQILKFAPGGDFLKNIVRGGQGPGEVSPYFNFLVGKDDIFIIDYGQERIIRISTDGILIHQWRPLQAYNDFFGILKDGLIFCRTNDPPLEERKGKLTDVPHQILRVSLDGTEEQLVRTYPVLEFLGPGYAASWAPFHAALSDDGRYAFVNHTTEYEVSVLDLVTGKTVRVFDRDYRRVKHVPLRGEAEFNRKYNFRKPYETDINGLFVFGDRLWVKTSTEDKESGALYDVYSFDGIYRDAFLLKENVLCIQRGQLLTWESDEDGINSVVIYRPR
jgi:hypothetical protein